VSITLTVTDDSGANSTCTSQVTVEDNIAPLVVCRDAEIALDANGLSPEINDNDFIRNTFLTSLTDNCTTPEITAFDGQAFYFCSKLETITFFFSDLNGNQTPCTSTVTFIDPTGVCNVAPTAVCESVTINLDCLNTISAEAFDGGSTDPNMDVLTFSVVPAGPYPIGTTNVTLSVSDDIETSQCTTNITVVEPVITLDDCGGVVTLYLDENGTATLPTTTVSTRRVTDTLFSNAQPDGTGTLQSYTIPDGITEISLEAVGGNGGDARINDPFFESGGKGARLSSDFAITDQRKLQIIVAGHGQESDPISNNGGGGGATFVAFGETGFTDFQNENILMIAGGGGGTGSLGSGINSTERQLFPAGESGIDVSPCETPLPGVGASASSSSMIDCPDGPNFNQIRSGKAAIDGANGGTDPAGVLPGGFGGGGAGNNVSGPGPTGDSFRGGGGGGGASGGNPGISNSGGQPGTSYAGGTNISPITPNPRIDGDGYVVISYLIPEEQLFSRTEFTCNDLEENITVTATRLNGCGGECTFEVTVLDTLGPVIAQTNLINLRIPTSRAPQACPGNPIFIDEGLNQPRPVSEIIDLCVEYLPPGVPVTFFTMLFEDNCTEDEDLDILVTNIETFEGAEGADSIVLNGYLIDEYGNRSVLDTATIVLVDDIDPEITCQEDLTVFLDENGEATIVDTFSIITSLSDNCTDSTGIAIVLEAPTFSCDDLGTSTATLTVTDGSGNEATCAIDVTPVDNIPPTVIPNDQTVHLNDDNITVTLIEADLLDITDNCDPMPTVVFDRSLTFTGADIGTNVLTATVTDASGNTTTVMVTVTVTFDQPNLACIGEINLTLADDCTGLIIPDIQHHGDGCRHHKRSDRRWLWFL